MDSTELIRQKREEYRSLQDPKGIDLVLRHLDTAERHFVRGRDGDSDAFTDVIYRTNQVFEGILKEAYEVLSGSVGHRRTPYQIEQYFVDNDIFSPRVIDYFKRYREDWRNPSAHDHRLDFDEREAFLALSSVSAFCYVAIDQMVQELAAKATQDKSKVSAHLDLRHGKAFAERLALLISRTLQGMDIDPHAPAPSEVFLLGVIEGLINSAVPDIEILQEPAVEIDGRSLRPDLLLIQKDVRAVLELKRVRSEDVAPAIYGPALREQLLHYIKGTNSEYGIAIVFPAKLSADKLPDFVFSTEEETGVLTVFIYPEGSTSR